MRPEICPAVVRRHLHQNSDHDGHEHMCMATRQGQEHDAALSMHATSVATCCVRMYMSPSMAATFKPQYITADAIVNPSTLLRELGHQSVSRVPTQRSAQQRSSMIRLPCQRLVPELTISIRRESLSSVLLVGGDTGDAGHRLADIWRLETGEVSSYNSGSGGGGVGSDDASPSENAAVWTELHPGGHQHAMCAR